MQTYTFNNDLIAYLENKLLKMHTSRPFKINTLLPISVRCLLYGLSHGERGLKYINP